MRYKPVDKKKVKKAKPSHPWKRFGSFRFGQNTASPVIFKP